MPQVLGLLSFAQRGSPIYFKVIFLPIAGTLASGLILTPVVMGASHGRDGREGGCVNGEGKKKSEESKNK